MPEPLIPILNDILNELRRLSTILEARSSAIPVPCQPRTTPVALSPDVPRILAEWHQRQGARRLTAREVVTLGIQGMPFGSLRAVVFALSDWTGLLHVHHGVTYQLVRRTSHNQSHWSVELVS